MHQETGDEGIKPKNGTDEIDPIPFQASVVAMGTDVGVWNPSMPLSPPCFELYTMVEEQD